MANVAAPQAGAVMEKEQTEAAIATGMRTDETEAGTAHDKADPPANIHTADLDNTIIQLRREVEAKAILKRPSAASGSKAILKKPSAASGCEELPACPFNHNGGVIYVDKIKRNWRVFLVKGDRIGKTVAWGPTKDTKVDSFKRAVNMIDLHLGAAKKRKT